MIKKESGKNKEVYKVAEQGCDLENLEFEIKPMLDYYHIEYPSESEIDKTIKTLMTYMPTRKKSNFFIKKIIFLLRNAWREFSHISLFFWISNSLFYVSGLVLIFMWDFNPYLTVMFLSPIPFILGLIEVFKGREEGMAELEMTLKHSYQEILLSKMVVVSSYNLVLNLFITIILSLSMKDVWTWKLILYWMTPFTVVSLLALVIESKIRNSYTTSSITMLIWLTITTRLAISTEIQKWIESIHVTYFVLINLLSVMIAVKLFIRKGEELAFDNTESNKKVWR